MAPFDTQKHHPRKKRISVRVQAVFDMDGYVMPKRIMWSDGRVFKIDRVVDFFPSFNPPRIKYTVLINKQLRDLYFERIETETTVLGQWYMEILDSSN